MVKAIALPEGRPYLDPAGKLGPQIVDDIKTRILSGQYPQGGPLPSLSAQAEFYGIPDQTMSGALVRLIKEGWVKKVGYGRYQVATVCPPITPDEEESKPNHSRARPDLALSCAESPVVAVVIPPSATCYLCPSCGIWAQIEAAVLAAIPAQMTLACAACQAILLPVRLDPAKQVGR
jgi:DNA-binding transcriptional MocR family regulator